MRGGQSHLSNGEAEALSEGCLLVPTGRKERQGWSPSHFLAQTLPTRVQDPPVPLSPATVPKGSRFHLK